jgi:hypothetical protein
MVNWKINKNGFFEIGKSEELSYPEIGNELCFAIEENSPWFNQRNELILHYLDKYKANGDFIDIGGGNGFQSKALINANYPNLVILCEPGVKGCLNAKSRGVELVYQGFFQDFPFDEYNIGNCGLFDVIEHIEDDLSFLNELYSKVKFGTRIFINVPANNYLWSETDEVSGHYRRYEKSDLNRILKNTPFKILDYTFYFSYYLLPLLLARVLPYKLGIRIGAEKLLLKEQKNHKKNKGILDKYFQHMHNLSLKKLNNNKKIYRGTSLFLVLEK